MARSDINISKCAIVGSECRELFVPLEIPEARSLVDIGVTLAGVSNLRPPYEMSRPDPKHLVFLMITSGSMRFQTENGHRIVSGETAILLPAGRPHRYWLDRDSTHLTWVHLASSGRWAGLPPEIQELRIFPKRIAQMMRTLIRECRGTRADARDASRSWAELLAIELQRALLPERESQIEQKELLARLWEKVDANLQQNWRVEHMARELHMSRGHFTRTVKTHYGCSAQRYLSGLRVRRAQQLLLAGEFTLEAISTQVGYSSPFALSKAFKKITGASPRATVSRH